MFRFVVLPCFDLRRSTSSPVFDDMICSLSHTDETGLSSKSG